MTTERPLPTGIRTLNTQNGQTRFQARVFCRRSGKEYCQRFSGLDEALQWRQQVMALIEAGVDPSSLSRKQRRKNTLHRVDAPAPTTTAAESASASPGMTVGEAVDNYIKHRQNSHHPIPSNYLTDYKRVMNDWDGFLVSDLRNEDLANYMALLLRTPLKRDAHKPIEQARLHQPATVRKFAYALQLALEWNAKNKNIELHPFLFDYDRGTLPSGWKNKRERRLQPGEEQKLYEAGLARGSFTYSRQDWENIIGFALETAMREQEIVYARWDRLLDENTKLVIPAEHTKTRRARHILLSKRAREIIEAQKQHRPENEPRIFYQVPNPKSLCTAFARLTARAGIPDLHFHDLRHEATSRLCESGKLNQMAIMEMTGHSTMQTFQSYVHLIRDGLKTQLD